MPNDCPLGQEFRNGACQWCSGGSVKPTGADRCMQCSDGEKTVANAARTECITEQQCESITGAVVVNNVCTCKDAGTAINNAGDACVRCGDKEVPNGVGSACVCTEGYGVDNKGVCEKCSIGTVHYKDLNESEKKMCTGQKPSGFKNTIDICSFMNAQMTCQRIDGCYWKNNICSSCSGGNPVANIAKNDCISEAQCYANNGSIYEDDGRKQCKCAPGLMIIANGNACQRCENGLISTKTNQSICDSCTSPFIARPQHDGCIDINACQKAGGTAVSNQCRCTTGFLVLDENSQLKCKNCNHNEQSNFYVDQCVCNPGYGVPNNGGITCSACPPGSYANPGSYDTEKKKCNVCTGDGYVSNVAQTRCQTIDECQKVGLNSKAVGKQCYCIAGHERNTLGQCVLCGSNKINHDYALECMLCTGVGTISNQAHTACICAEGYGADSPNSQCQQCQGNTFHTQDLTETKKEPCMGCDASQHLVINSTKNGCVCTVGYERDTNGNCKLCDEGQFKEAAGNETCKSCATDGSEISNETRTVCICSGGFGVSENACVKCPAGTFHTSDSRETQKVQCKKCPPGNYSESGSQVCQPCNGNSVSSEEGSVRCTPCENDLVPNKEKTRCIDVDITRTSSNPTPVIAGCVIALLALITLIVVLIIMLRKRRNSFGKKGVNNINRTNYYNERVRKNVSAKDDQGKRIHQQPDTSKVLMSQNNGSGRNKAQINRKKEQHGAAKRSAFIVGATDGRV